MCQAYESEARFVDFLERTYGRCPGGCGGTTYCNCLYKFRPEQQAARLVSLHADKAREVAESLRDSPRSTHMRAPAYWNEVILLVDSVVILGVPAPGIGWT